MQQSNKIKHVCNTVRKKKKNIYDDISMETVLITNCNINY